MKSNDEGVNELEKGEIEDYCRIFLKENYNIDLSIPITLNC